ncbi:phage major capsid protein [Alkalibacillus almallahensis]|uniref:phage major capsid protein n=1 Tax=Alkalibacillus almallahensis TaxID=1379154 RepID=UPI0014226D64
MTKHEQDLRQQVTDLKAEAQTLQDDKKYEEAKAKLAEAKQAKSDLDNFLALQDDFNNLQVPQPQQRGTQLGGEPQGEKDNEYKALFFKTVRGQSLTSDEVDELEKYKARVSSDSGEDGGYIIPEDIQTRINELRQTNDDLRQYVNVQPVSTNKGSRTLERRAEHTPLQPLSEYGDPDAMAEMDSPKFDRLDYDIEDRAGFLPVPNSVLNDTDQALEDYLVRWISKKSKATDNHLILQQINSLTKETLNDYRGIKTTLNVTLDPSFAQEAAIYTNQDGFNYLDQLEDDNGRPLLQPDPTQPTRKLFAGAHPIVVLSNKTISTVVDETAGTEMAPFIIGVLDEGIVLWDRQQLSIDMTKVGGQAWRSNTTEFRAIVREDVTQWDDEAVVFAEIDVATPEA